VRLHRTAEPPSANRQCREWRQPSLFIFPNKQFRCIGQVSIDPLKRINLIAGDNNAGKTALLEAVFLHCGAFNPSLVATLAGLRGIGSYKLESGHPASTALEFAFSRPRRIETNSACGEGQSQPLSNHHDQHDIRPARHGSREVGFQARGCKWAGHGHFRRRTDVLRWQHSGGGREDVVLLFFDGPESGLTLPPYEVRFSLAASSVRDGVRTFRHSRAVWRVGDREEGRRTTQDPAAHGAKAESLSTVLLGGVPMLHADVGIGKLIPWHSSGTAFCV